MPRSRRRVLIVLLVGLTGVAAAVIAVFWLSHHRPHSLIRAVIADPMVNWDPEDFGKLEEYVRKHGIESAQEREAFCNAAVERAVRGKEDLLAIVIVPGLRADGRFAEVWDIAASRIKRLASGSDILLNHLSAIDKTRARSLVNYPTVLERSDDEMLIASALLLMDKATVEANRKSLGILQHRHDVSDWVKNVATKMIHRTDTGPAPGGAEKKTGKDPL